MYWEGFAPGENREAERRFGRDPPKASLYTINLPYDQNNLQQLIYIRINQLSSLSNSRKYFNLIFILVKCQLSLIFLLPTQKYSSQPLHISFPIPNFEFQSTLLFKNRRMKNPPVFKNCNFIIISPTISNRYFYKWLII